MNKEASHDKDSVPERAETSRSPSSESDSLLGFLALIIFGVWVAIFLLWTPVQKSLGIPRTAFTVRDEYWVAGGFLTAWYFAGFLVDRHLQRKFQFAKLFLFILVAFILTVLCPVHMSTIAVSQMPQFKPQRVNPD